MADTTITPTGFARVNGVALQSNDGMLSDEELRQRACSELLRQAAIAEGLLDGAGIVLRQLGAAKIAGYPVRRIENDRADGHQGAARGDAIHLR